VAALSLDKKGLRPIILDLRDLSSVADCFVIVSGNSSTQTFAILDHVQRELAKIGIVPNGIESDPEGKWILLDLVTVIMHVFTEDSRDFYCLERLWGEAKTVSL